MKRLLLQVIRTEYQALLHLPDHLSEQAWAHAVAKADPVFFYLNDGTALIQIGEASRHSLLECIMQELGAGS